MVLAPRPMIYLCEHVLITPGRIMGKAGGGIGMGVVCE